MYFSTPSMATVSYTQSTKAKGNTSVQSVSNVSSLLDSLLSNYDNSLRPDFGGNQVIRPDRSQISTCRAPCADRGEHAGEEHGPYL